MSHMPTSAQPSSSSSSSTPSVSLTNSNVGTVVAGTPVYSSSAGHFDKAKANASTTTKVIGLAAADIATATAGLIQVSSVLTLTTAQWDAVAGTTGGLTFNTNYYLSASTAGMLTSTAPSSSGQFAVLVGRALSTTQMAVFVQPEIGL